MSDKGYHGYDQTGRHVITPYKDRNKPESQKDANRAHARLRGPGERANAQLKAWRILRTLRYCPAAPADRPKPSMSHRTTRSPQGDNGSVIGLRLGRGRAFAGVRSGDPGR